MRTLVIALLVAASSLLSAVCAAAPPLDDPTKPIPWSVGGGEPAEHPALADLPQS